MPHGSSEGENEAKVEPQDQRDEEQARKKGRPGSCLLAVTQSDPHRGAPQKEAGNQKEAAAKENNFAKGVLDRKGLAGDHFLSSVNLRVRKSTWFLIFLSTLILCSITSEAYRIVE